MSFGHDRKRQRAHDDLARTDDLAMYHYITRHEGEELWKCFRTAIALGSKVKKSALSYCIHDELNQHHSSPTSAHSLRARGKLHARTQVPSVAFASLAE